MKLTPGNRRPLHRRNLALWLVLLFSALSQPDRAGAQMVTGSAMENFQSTFGLSARGWSVQQTACSQGANVLGPGEEATFTFFLKPGQPFQGPLKVDVIQYGTRGKPGDWWKPVVFKIADISITIVAADLPAEGGMVIVGDLSGSYDRQPGPLSLGGPGAGCAHGARGPGSGHQNSGGSEWMESPMNSPI